MMKRTVISMGLKFAALGLGFGVTAIMARVMAPADLGLYSFGISVVMILGVLAQFGLPTLATREIARLCAVDNLAVLPVFGRFLRITLLASVCVSMGLGYVLLTYVLPLPEGFAPYIFMVLLIVPLNAVLKLVSGQVRGLNLTIASQIPELLIRPGVLFMVVLGFYLVAAGPLELMPVFVAYAAAATLGMIFAIFTLRMALSSRNPDRHSQAGVSGQWIRSSIPLMLTSGVVVLNQNLDILVVGAMTTPEDIALYRVSTRLTALVAFGLAAVSAVVAPQIARHYYKKDMGAVQRIARSSALQSLALALPFVVVFMLFPEQILALAFGSDYAAGATVLRILCLGQLINASFGVLGVILNMTGQERYTVIGVAIAAAISTALNLVLVPSFGIEGAALAQLASFAIWNGLLAYFIFVRLDIVVLPFLPRKQT